MSKDLVIAGVLVSACLVVSAIAFIPPKDGDGKKPTSTLGAIRKPTVEPTSPGSELAHPADPLAPIGQHPGNEPLTPLPFDPFAKNDPSKSTTADPFAAQPTPNTFAPNPLPSSSLPKPAIDLTPVQPALGSVEQTHVVAKGEMLGDISLKYYNTSKKWRLIKEANPGLDEEHLVVGQKLIIPALKDQPVAAKPTVGTTPGPDGAAGERTYTVKEGDRYYTIAQKELGDASRWKDIETLNKTPSEDLKVGQVLKLPARKEPGVPGTSPAEKSDVPDGKKRHVVAAGDTLGTISQTYYGTSKRWKDIEKANPGVDSERLFVGQKLIIPDVAADAPAKGEKGDKPNPTGTSASPIKTETSEPAGDTVEYTVKSGDYLTTIAEHFYHSKAVANVERIQKANPGIDSRNLRVGQKIKIPGVKSDAVPATKPNEPPKSTNPFAPPVNPFAPEPLKSPPGSKPAANPFAPLPDAGARKPDTSPFGAATPGSAPAPAPFGAPKSLAPTPATGPAPAPASPTVGPKPWQPAPFPGTPPSTTPPAKADGTHPASANDDPFKDFFAR